jgi:MFS family permease
LDAKVASLVIGGFMSETTRPAPPQRQMDVGTSMEAGSETWPNPKYAWYVVIMLTAVYTLSFIDRQIISLLVGPIKADLQISDFQLSLLQGAAFAIFYTILGLPLGRLADRVSRRNMIAVGIFLWSIMTVACGLTKTYGQLFLARIGVGVGEATLSPCAYSMISDYFPKEKLARALSVYFMGVYLGTGLAFILGGAVIEMVAGMGQIAIPLVGEINNWQITFIAVGLPGIAFTLLMYTVKEPRRRGVIKNNDGSANQISFKYAFKYMFQRWQVYILLATSMGFHALMGYGASAWVPEFFIRTFDMVRSDAAYTFGIVVLLTATTGVYAGGWLADWLEDKGHKDAKIKTIKIGLAAMAIPYILFPLMPTVTSAVITLAVATFFGAFPYGVAASIIQVVTPNQMRGLITAAYLFILNFIGLNFGSSTIAAFTDFVFEDPSKLGYSMAATAVFSIPISYMLIAWSRRAYLERLDDSREWGQSRSSQN